MGLVDALRSALNTLSRGSDDWCLAVGVLAELIQCSGDTAKALGAAADVVEILVHAARGAATLDVVFCALARALESSGDAACVAFTSCGGVELLLGIIDAWVAGQSPALAIGACKLLTAFVTGAPDTRDALVASGKVFSIVDKMLPAAAAGSSLAAAALCALGAVIDDSASLAAAFISRGADAVLLAHVVADGTEAQAAAFAAIASMCTLCSCAAVFLPVVETAKRVLVADPPVSLRVMEACISAMTCLWNVSPATAAWLATSNALEHVAHVGAVLRAMGS